MEMLISYFILSLIPNTLILLRFYLNSKKKRKKGDLKHRVVNVIIQSSTVLLIIISYAIFLTNFKVFMKASSSTVEISLIGFSQLSLVSSSILFVFTFKSSNLYMHVFFRY